MICVCFCWVWFIKLWLELLLRRFGWVWLKLAFMQILGFVCDVVGLLVISFICFCVCGFSVWEVGGVGLEVLVVCLGRLGAEEFFWFRGFLFMVFRLFRFVLFGCFWVWSSRFCCTGLLAFIFFIFGLIVESLFLRRSFDSCLCLEVVFGIRFLLFKRFNFFLLGISLSGRLFFKLNNDLKFRN